MLSITGIRRTSTLTAWHFSSTHPVPPDAKGVKVSHGNLLHNQRMIQEAFDHTEQACIVGRLPPYHKLEGLTAQSLSGQAPSNSSAEASPSVASADTSFIPVTVWLRRLFWSRVESPPLRP